MGKVTGFLEFDRLIAKSEAPSLRTKHHKEFLRSLSESESKIQSARCMDCGIPFCNDGCPVNNIIPDWNDLVYSGNYKEALDNLHSTNNFPEFTGRICPAPCEAACTLGISDKAVGIKSIEHFIIDKGWENGWVIPKPSRFKTEKRIAIVGSGPAGMAAAQQLVRVGHSVDVFEKNDRVGGLLRYGIPDFKMEKYHIDRRIDQMRVEGVTFHTGVLVGKKFPKEILNLSMKIIAPEKLMDEFDAVIIAGGAEWPRDLPISGRQLEGVHFAMEFLPQQNRLNAGDNINNKISAKNKHVVVIGGGDTGSDCVGTSNRHGALSVKQLELMPQPPEEENKSLIWPFWPTKLRTSSSHEEGCDRDWSIATKKFVGRNGRLEKLIASRVKWSDKKMIEIPNSEFEIKADLVLLALGFVSPVSSLLDSFGVEKDKRGNVKASTDDKNYYRTSLNNVFAAGDVRRGQSLVVWAIKEGRQCARSVDEFLMGFSKLPK